MLWPFLMTCAMLLQDERHCAEDQAVCQSPHCHRWVHHTLVLVIMVPPLVLPPPTHTHTLLLSSYTCDYGPTTPPHTHTLLLSSYTCDYGPTTPHTHTLLLSSYTCYHRDTPQLWGHSTQTSTVCSQENIQSELLLFWILALSFTSICAYSLHTPPSLKYISFKLDTFVEAHLEFARSHCITEHSVALGSSIIWQAYIFTLLPVKLYRFWLTQ